MKKQFLVTIFLTGIFAFVFISSCKKDSKTTERESLNPEVKQHNNDANYYKSESDQVDNDINDDLRNHPSMQRVEPGTTNNPLFSPLCGVTIDAHDSANKILYYNFDGVTPCFTPSRTRAGQIKVQLTSGNKWGDVNAVLTLTYINFKVTRLYDNKSITFNGVKTLKNINGNDWIGFLLGTSKLKYQERALNIAVKFDSGLNATWNSARITEWSYTPANAKVAFNAIGDSIVNGYSNVDSWGVNRYGYAFTTYYHAALVSNTYCGLWRFNSGELVHHVNNNDFTFTFGVDQNGNPTPYACAYGYKVVWVGTNGTASVILSY